MCLFNRIINSRKFNNTLSPFSLPSEPPDLGTVLETCSSPQQGSTTCTIYYSHGSFLTEKCRILWSPPFIIFSLYKIPIASPQVTGSWSRRKSIFVSLGTLGPARKHVVFSFHLALTWSLLPHLEILLYNLKCNGRISPMNLDTYLGLSLWQVRSIKLISLYIPILWNPIYTPLEEGYEFPSLPALATYCTIIFFLLFWRKIYSHIIALKLYRWRKSLNFSFFLPVWGLNWGNKAGLQWAPRGSVPSSCFGFCFASLLLHATFLCG